jgi:hypothetical protein
MSTTKVASALPAQMTFEERMAVIDNVLVELETLSMQKANIETAVKHFANGTRKIVARMRMEVDAARELRDSYKTQRDQLREELERTKLAMSMRVPSGDAPAVERSQSMRAVRSNANAELAHSQSERALSARTDSSRAAMSANSPAPSSASPSSPRSSPFRVTPRAPMQESAAPAKPLRAPPALVAQPSPPPTVRPVAARPPHPDYAAVPLFRDGNYDVMPLATPSVYDGATVLGDFDDHPDDDDTVYGEFQ